MPTSRPREGRRRPLEAGRGKRIPKQLQQPEEPENTATVVYTGHIPHGFYEEQMQVYHVAKVVADEMNNYLLFEHTLRVALVPPEKVHPKLHNKDKTTEEHKKMVEGIVNRDEKHRKRIKAAGIEYECPGLLGSNQPAAKKKNFDEDQ
ncbi:hypothetical protein SETIT_6G143100v2 [Setaria italica]|uniref:Uncharacterized protein n=1 Tax=Setaria italica TaxID=4555 RepID=A0A368RLV6_SETIT|nr:hypothetical protein SETIT_6G143100v2 [Setaria italica]